MGARSYWDKKDLVDESTMLSIFKLKEFGLLKGCCGSTLTWTSRLSGHKSSISIWVDTGHLIARVNYTVTDRSDGAKTDYDYGIELTTTPCSLGGVRFWFTCRRCRGRVGTLFIAPGDGHFLCRECGNLSYASRNESRLCRPGGYGYALVLDRRIDELHKQIRRWNYGGRPTRRAMRLEALYRLQERSIATAGAWWKMI